MPEEVTDKEINDLEKALKKQERENASYKKAGIEIKQLDKYWKTLNEHMKRFEKVILEVAKAIDMLNEIIEVSHQGGKKSRGTQYQLFSKVLKEKSKTRLGKKRK